MAQTSRISKNNTTLTTRNGVNVLTLHSTEIVHHNITARTITLNSGGFRTSTTKNRMAQYFNTQGLKIAVFQKAREWFVRAGGETVKFFDGMTVKVPLNHIPLW